MSKTLAEIVLDEGLADSPALDVAARFADARDEPLVVGLVRECGVDEVALVAAIRRQMRVAVCEPDGADVDVDALREVAREVAWKRRAMPLSISAYGDGRRVLRVAMADPSDAVALAEVEHRSGCEVEPSLMVLSGVEQLIERSYREFTTQVIKREPGAASARTARPRAAEGSSGTSAQPATTPFHRVSDEVDSRTLVRTLVELLEEKGVLAEGEFERRVIEFMKSREA